MVQPRLGKFLVPGIWGRDLWRHRHLIGQFVLREIQGRYRGTILGGIWSFLTPLAMLGIYTAVFGGVFHARWPGLAQEGTQGLLAFAVAMFAGSTTFTIFSEPVAKAPGLIVGVPNYVKKVVFPLEVLPPVLLLTALFHALFAFCLVLIGAVVVQGHLPWTAVLLPVLAIPCALLALGTAWFLASLGVYLRDSGQVVAVILQILFFITPIFYAVEAIPPRFQWVLLANPLTYCITLVRDCLLIGRLPDPLSIAIAFGSGILVAQAGYAWFMLTKRGFADVI